MERALNRKTDELNKQLKDLSQKYAEIKNVKEKLVEDNARQTSEILAVQNLLQKQHVPLEQVEALKNLLMAQLKI